MAMRECKRCYQVKPLRKFFGIYYRNPFSMGMHEVKTWLCKSCAQVIGYDACVKESEKIGPYIT